VKIAARYIEGRTDKRATDVTVSGESEVDSKLKKLERELTIVGEETNILWWLVSEYSRDRNESWKILGLPATSIIAGKELADLTRVIPGPVAATAFLDRIVRCSDSDNSAGAIELMGAINSTPREWREQYPFESSSIVDLMPIGRGIKLSLTVAEGDDWSRVFQKGTDIVVNSKLVPRVLAYQVFLERMLSLLRGKLG
jgi:hypothetical protein